MQLQRIIFNKDIWYVNNFIKSGLSLISGRPKDGKSRLMLYMAVCIATGMPFLSKYQTVKTGVYFITFEESLRLLQKRLSKILLNRDFPENLVFPKKVRKVNRREKITIDFPKFDQGGLKVLEEVIVKNKNIKVIIFDNIGKAFAQRTNRNSFEEDYTILSPLQELANKYEVAIIGIHHNRKQSAINPIDEMMGSSSLSAVADSIFILRKINPTDRSLHITGRDIEEKNLGIRVNNVNDRWKEIELDKTQKLSHEQRSAYKHFEKSSKLVFRNKHIALIEKLSPQSCARILKALVRKGLIVNVSNGKYRLAS